jgi:iron complex transport system permease protein
MKNKWWIIPGLVMLLIAVSILSLSIGPAQTTEIIFWQIRLPRVWIGVVVGGALAVAGVVYQAILRNPLADPFMLGTSSGASLGVILAGSLGATSPVAFYSSAMLGAWGAVQLVCGISRGARTQSVASFALSGVVVSTFLNAVVFIILLKPTNSSGSP